MILCYHPAVRCEPVQGSGEMEALVTQNLLNAPPWHKIWEVLRYKWKLLYPSKAFSNWLTSAAKLLEIVQLIYNEQFQNHSVLGPR